MLPAEHFCLRAFISLDCITITLLGRAWYYFKLFYFSNKPANSTLRTVIVRFVLLSEAFRLTVVDFFREFY